MAIVNRKSLATIAIGIAQGADIYPVHDIKEIACVCKMSDAIIRGQP